MGLVTKSRFRNEKDGKLEIRMDPRKRREIERDPYACQIIRVFPSPIYKFFSFLVKYGLFVFERAAIGRQ
ncbi:hypothetical protein B9Z55_000668 [Caenorhabditis nigoni]|uniref:Uncharacterized protein n=1 Tax=Caenorhabditis nigoni TaxID=1611254 RepID=A0A2G5VU91_9PELO|nr:hypothetical protein B9Z55_000668 [Caenorhabditis nigoni]